MKVKDLMARWPAAVRPSDGLDQAMELMRERECGCLPVVDADSKVLGVVTDRDVALAALRARRPLSALEVGDACSASAFTCHADDTIAEAERLMGQHQVRRLPVIDADGRLQGLVSLDEIAREAFREESLVVHPVSAEAVGITLGQICRPHLVCDVTGRGPRER